MNIFSPAHNLSFWDYLKILRRRIWYFIIPCILIMVGGFYCVLTLEDEFDAYCFIQIQPNALSFSMRGVGSGFSQMRQSMINLPRRLRSRPNLTRLIDKMGLRSNEIIIARAVEFQVAVPDMKLPEIIDYLLIKKLKKDISVRVQRDDEIKLGAKGSTPEEALGLVQNLLDIFTEEFLESENLSLQNAMEFNYEQLNSFKIKLEQSEKKLKDFKRNFLIIQEIDDLQNQISSKTSSLRALNAQLSGDVSVAAAVPRTPKNRSLFGNLYKRIEQLSELMRLYGWNQEEIVQLERNLDNVRDRLKSDFQRYYSIEFASANPQMRNLVVDKAITLVDLEIYRARIKGLNEILGPFDIGVLGNASKESKLSELGKEVELNRKIFETFLERGQGAQIEESIQRASASSRIRIVEPPQLPLESSNSGATTIILLTCFGAFIVGIIAVSGREFLNSTLQSVEEAEVYFEIPVIGVMSNLRAASGYYVQPKRNTKATVAYAAAAGTVIVLAVFGVVYLRAGSMQNMLELLSGILDL